MASPSLPPMPPFPDLRPGTAVFCLRGRCRGTLCRQEEERKAAVPGLPIAIPGKAASGGKKEDTPSVFCGLFRGEFRHLNIQEFRQGIHRELMVLDIAQARDRDGSDDPKVLQPQGEASAAEHHV